MKKQILITLIISMISGLTIYAQDYVGGQQQYKNYFGAGAGFTTGFGLSYRYIPEKFGAQINFTPYYDRNRNSLVSAGLTFLQRLHDSKDAGLYLYFSNSLLYTKTYHTAFSYPYSYPYNYSTESSIYNTGIGLDVQFYTGNSPIVFDLMGGFGSYDSFQLITVTVEIAIYYRL